jgi:hypothetical protein
VVDGDDLSSRRAANHEDRRRRTKPMNTPMKKPYGYKRVGALDNQVRVTAVKQAAGWCLQLRIVVTETEEPADIAELDYGGVGYLIRLLEEARKGMAPESPRDPVYGLCRIGWTEEP